MDPFAAQILIKSGIPVIIIGAEVGLSSMWLYQSDLNHIHSSSSSKGSTSLVWTLSDYTNKTTTVYKWLQFWKGLGKYLSPWPTDEKIDGMFVCLFSFLNECLKCDFNVI